jgi:hypothetical protein
MPEAQDPLRHDLTALFVFVDSVSRCCVSKNTSLAYTPAHDRFFRFISDLAHETKDQISRWSAETDAELEDRRAELQSIRDVWKEFHNFIKPTLDADTLHAPYSVIEGIIRRARELPDCEDLDVAIFLTAEPTYVQVRAAAFHANADKIRSVIPNAPRFPPELAVIGVPYAFDSAVFQNCLIAHELGHHVA